MVSSPIKLETTLLKNYELWLYVAYKKDNQSLLFCSSVEN